jgi:hypothetical protein
MCEWNENTDKEAWLGMDRLGSRREPPRAVDGIACDGYAHPISSDRVGPGGHPCLGTEGAVRASVDICVEAPTERPEGAYLIYS